MVKSAYSSGKPAYGVGPGNAVQLLCEDADARDAAQKIAMSKSFDNATSCSSENSAVVHRAVWDEFLTNLQKEGGFLCTPAQKKALRHYLWIMNTQGQESLNPTIIAKNADVIARGAWV